MRFAKRPKGQLLLIHTLLIFVNAGMVVNGFGPNTCSSSNGNITKGICCDVSGGNSNGTLETFASNSTEACCSACFNNTQCSTWTLTLSNSTDAAPPSHTATSNCTLHSSCAASAGNCTRGEMPPPTPPGPKPPPGGLGYRFVATWRGMHKKESGEGISDGEGSAVSSSSSWNSSASLSNLGNEVGDCTCSLIAPFWIITAEHCAERVLKHEKVDVKINFHGDSPHVERSITHCVRAKEVDVAICRLTAKVGAFPPVAINPEVMKSGHGSVDVTTIGTKGGLHEVGPKRLEYEKSGAHLYVKKGGGMKAGDSGGPWVQKSGGHYYLVGVLHGSGIAGQPSYIRGFLDSHIDGIIWDKP